MTVISIIKWMLKKLLICMWNCDILWRVMPEMLQVKKIFFYCVLSFYTLSSHYVIETGNKGIYFRFFLDFVIFIITILHRLIIQQIIADEVVLLLYCHVVPVWQWNTVFSGKSWYKLNYLSGKFITNAIYKIVHLV